MSHCLLSVVIEAYRAFNGEQPGQWRCLNQKYGSRKKHVVINTVQYFFP